MLHKNKHYYISNQDKKTFDKTETKFVIKYKDFF
jgi:hypothetical protein